METRIESLKKMLSENPEDDFLNYAFALELSKNNFSEALKILVNLLKKKPNYLATYFQLGHFYEQNQEPEKAILIYKRGMEVAKIQKNQKTFSELNEAFQQLSDD
ncbi:MAG: tetratricopeptide repeat protein [Bacteroidia bacterium]